MGCATFCALSYGGRSKLPDSLPDLAVRLRTTTISRKITNSVTPIENRSMSISFPYTWIDLRLSHQRRVMIRKIVQLFRIGDYHISDLCQCQRRQRDTIS